MIINGYNIEPGANLIDADLTGVILTGVDLTRADLTDAELIGANLTGANLTMANLIWAILFDANLTRAILIEADLTRANLTDAILIGVNLTRAILIEADLEDAILIDAILIDANLIDADLRGANLRGANLKGANITGADLTGADLTQASSLQFCLALNSNIKGAINTVDELLDLIEKSKNNKEESAICKGHLKWIEDNMEQLIHNNYITDEDKAKIDDYRDLRHLSQCSTGTKKTTDKEGPNQGLTGTVKPLCVEGELGSSDKGQER